jgi:hypothetical protein
MAIIQKVNNRIANIIQRRKKRSKINSLLQQEYDDLNLSPVWYIDIDTRRTLKRSPIANLYTVFGFEIPLADIQWHKDYVSGFEYPFERFDKIKIARWYNMGIDVKYPWEVSRFYFGVHLAQNFQITGEDEYYAKFKTLVLDWFEKNPFLYGINWHCTMEVAIRAVNWIVAINIFGKKFFSDRKFYEKVGSSLVQHADYIHTFPEIKRNGRSNNHLIADYFGLLFLALTLRDHPNHNTWLQTSVNGLVECMNTQVHDDGTSFEGSIPYHRLVLEMFGYAAVVCRSNNIDLPTAYYERLFKMFEFTAAYSDHNGNAPQIGDNDSGRTIILHDSDEHDHSYLLDLGETLFDHTFLSQCIKRNIDLNQWFPEFAKVEMNLLTVRPRDVQRSIYFQKGGYYFLKNKDLSVSIPMIDGKETGRRGHIHLDIGSMSVSYKGIPFIVDPGTYTYTRNLNEREKYIGDRYHNTFVVKGEVFKYSRTSGFFDIEIKNRLNITERSDTTISFLHDYYGELVERFIIINDNTLVHRGFGCKENESFFHLHPACMTTKISDRQIIVNNGSYQVKIEVSVNSSIEEYDYSHGYGKREKADKLVAQGDTLQEVRFIFF